MDTDCACKNLPNVFIIYRLRLRYISSVVRSKSLSREVISRQLRKDKYCLDRAKVVSIGFVKESRNLRNGGQYHTYRASDIDRMKLQNLDPKIQNRYLN
jgi:predicted transcriptional regulator